NVLFFGVDKYDAVYLKRLISARKGTTPLIRHLAVVTVSPKERVSGSNKDTLWRGEVDKLAEENMLTTHYIHSSQINDWPVPVIREGGSVDTFNIAIVGNFSTQLPQNIVKHFSLGALDIHHSLLPKHRGPMPVEAAIMNNDEVTGVTICEYRVHKFNAGYILAQVPLTLTSTSLRSKIYEALSDIGKELLIKVLNNLDYVRENKIQQDEYEATYTQIYRPPDAKIIWEKMTAEEIVRRHRAFYGKLIMHTIWRKKNKMHPLLLLEMSLPDKESKPISPDYHLRPPGTLFFQRKVPYLETLCIDGSRVLIHKLRIQNRKVFDGPGFKNGYL
ncbi:formyl transferase, partial [Coemansia spiralis]